ncbi:serine/threonine-protein kinase [Streptomyces koelreuteriae]|uniref:serine/threonine-protein kinase n=1 Tax=Streptomyces koelreuteriae TaxID=2838015 RepID=UPI003EBDE339
MSNDGGGTGAQGRLIGGRYRLIEPIGSGGTGTVWRARDELVQREVAVRQPRLPGGPQDESHRRAAHRLHREARAAARVDHPAAVTIHDVVVEAERPEERSGPTGPDELDGAEVLDGLPWIVMESVRGESLDETLRRGPVDAVEAARIGLAVLGALRAAHSVGIVHRDVKPANVLLGPERRVVLTDFGIDQAGGKELLAAGGEFVAPERLSGRIAGPASDLWSLGALLYTAVEGSPPFRRTTREVTRAAILAAEAPEAPEPPESERAEPERAGPLGPLIVRLLAHDPDGRPDAEEVAKELEAVAGPTAAEPIPEFTQETPRLEETAEPPEAGPAERHDAPPKRQSLLRPAPLALLSALLAGGIGAATHLDGTSTAESAEQTADTADTWTPHHDPDLAAVLHLPRPYRELDRTGSATDQPRTVLYGDERGGTVQVRLLLWDRAPGSPVDQARKELVVPGDTRYTRTSVQGHDAALADTPYQTDEGPRRLTRVLIRTGEDRMYELRVDMPRGTAEEQEGTSVFEGARARLGLGPGTGS